ncbi:hypothetical protein Q4506_06640 [Colwellia sp. 4_MG-2023]|jgi:hypothetical protein|uniref:hypothetical protein n=1 Tax=unclassified Colwellia TaxID=196834 RepID=UPI001C08FC55|nr:MULTISPECIES: hypothetical protein [unclassified Colwellia]MBU2925839.1 hypothetical protein [Colwellia sp. C2M11]MDO6489120.1 hypothetical protein [Colwellia sp. 6_MG-2023]MDO6508201.1 hypothetical protein [Colwellia sp. 5_MG-2023]MDO6555350.1 hypothetical protein [Colwellia sp. 4_MG-2023]MDO6652764.1 hypothetical protein [Colwellia sp. 3_MG-2023]
MNNFIPLGIIFLLVIIQIKLFKDMCKYLSSTYPEEWEKLSENAMGEAKGSVTNANLSASLKSGFFATISDDKVVRFLKVRKLVMYLMGSIAILQLIMAYIL